MPFINTRLGAVATLPLLGLLVGCADAQTLLPRRDAALEAASDGAARADATAPVDASVPMDASTPPDASTVDATTLVDVTAPTDAAVIDAGPARDAVGPTVDATADARPAVDAAVDAAVADVVPDRVIATDAAPDASSPPARCTPVVDGALGATEYGAAVTVNNTVLPSAWGPNELRSLSACFDDNALYLAVRGSVEGGLPGGTANAIVLYVDRDFRGGAGGTATGISLLSALTDRSGRLDTALSAGFRTSAAVDGFGVEAGFGIWGTRSFTAMASDESQGWRLFWPAGGTPDRRADFAYVNAGVTTACQDRPGTMDDVCETAIRWTDLFEGPRPARTTVALFARIVNNDGSMSPDQTLPQDDPSSPRTVSRVLTLEVR